jgi:hypothetical protein
MRPYIPKPDLNDPVQRLDPTLLEEPAEPPPAADEPLDDDAAQAQGQNWVQALETIAVENGSDQPIDTLIEAELGEAPPRRHPDRDTPVADRGAGGRGGI